MDYNINANIDPATRLLTGAAKITYHNNSPDELNTIVVRLYHDVFKEGSSRRSSVNPEDIGNGTEISSLSVEEEEVDLNGDQVSRSGTNMYIRLSEPLAPESSVELEIMWHYTIPNTLRRTGVYDSTSYHVAYWYPQISVYDDIFGWDTMNYTILSEFYNNLANYDVTLTMPENFNIWATGMLQNPEEVFQDDILEKYKQAKTSEEVVHVITEDDLQNYKNKSGTWHYVAEEVSDFAFSVSDHYQWDAINQKVEDRNVLISTVFPKGQAQAYSKVTDYQKKTMKHFSEDMPGVAYPYPAFTTFIGLRGGGMEFPMMANNAGPGLGVTVHEMFHTYFPMYVRINERRFAAMDEGWAQYITQLVINKYFVESEDPNYVGLATGGGTMGTIEDLPLITSTQFMDQTNYGYASYSLPGFFYAMLHDYLGDEMFQKAYSEYINRWAQKSPTPYDFIFTMEDVTGEDLTWLFKPWFFNYGNADLAITDLKGNEITVENKGTRPVPLKLDVYYNDGSTKTYTKKADVWKNDKKYTITIDNAKEVNYALVSLGVPDESQKNNISPSMEKIYKSVGPDMKVSGEYMIDQVPLAMFIEEENGKLKIRVPRGGVNSWLIPVSDSEFKSLDGFISIEFIKEGDEFTAANISAQGQVFTAKRK
ncbi:M1 family metallopeptidase [Mangrovivirga cuniculi]|uniref:Peptidase M1 membrane alanine aminopeptidase domain-containing protein n=1 Tax=Mangrovivirga cuniculi TaxID=2715131 RepID=A0A4D7JFN2_9BACT|nr:M1 family metallopeptidase [Mangrovivirga cuniculi]QCK13923.1 hypothetical protein DCC35_03700 [Mangrovivirga cuniculi]